MFTVTRWLKITLSTLEITIETTLQYKDIYYWKVDSFFFISNVQSVIFSPLVKFEPKNTKMAISRTKEKKTWVFGLKLTICSGRYFTYFFVTFTLCNINSFKKCKHLFCLLWQNNMLYHFLLVVIINNQKCKKNVKNTHTIFCLMDFRVLVTLSQSKSNQPAWKRPQTIRLDPL